MKLHTLYPNDGATKKRKIVGRGPGSGLGKTCGKGHKGQNARSGGGEDLDLKEVNYHYLEDFLKEVLQMLNSKLFMLLLT